MKVEISKLDPEILKWKYGRPRDFWFTHRRELADFIKKNKIKPIDRKEFVMDDPVPIVTNVRTIKLSKDKEPVMIKPQPFPGFLRIPHFHFRNELYILTEKQWRTFGEMIVSKFQEKLSKARNVNFDQLMEISEAIDTLG